VLVAVTMVVVGMVDGPSIKRYGVCNSAQAALEHTTKRVHGVASLPHGVGCPAVGEAGGSRRRNVATLQRDLARRVMLLDKVLVDLWLQAHDYQRCINNPVTTRSLVN
jgi:hypothetical protein